MIFIPIPRCDGEKIFILIEIMCKLARLFRIWTKCAYFNKKCARSGFKTKPPPLYFFFSYKCTIPFK